MEKTFLWKEPSPGTSETYNSQVSTHSEGLMQSTWHQRKPLNVDWGMSARTSGKTHPLQLGNVLNTIVFSTKVLLPITTGSLYSFKYQFKMTYLAVTMHYKRHCHRTNYKNNIKMYCTCVKHFMEENTFYASHWGTGLVYFP